MDYLYINAIVNETYLDLSCGCAFPENYRRRLSGYVPNDDFLNTRAVENVFSYFTIKDNGKAPLLVLANVERQKNCASVGRATQVLGWEWNGKLIEKGMDPIFGAKLYTEDEIDRMVAAKERIPLAGNGPVPGLKEPIAIDFKTRKAILTAAFIRWLRHDDVLRIAVPAGVDYNSYVWQAMKQIYAFFPVALRAEAGFCSYLTDVKKAGTRIAFGFVPENMADSKTLFLDGSRTSALKAYENGTERRMLDQLIEFICGVDETTCQGFLEEVYLDLEGAGDGVKLASVTARDYQPMGEAVGLLVADDTPDKLMPRWKKFFAEQEQYSPSMRQRIGQKISSQIEPASFCQTYVGECRDAKSIAAVFEVLKSYDAFCRVSPELASAMYDATVKLLREKGATYKKIYEAISASRRDLAAVLTEDKLDQLFALKLMEEWQPLKNQAIKTVADADKALKGTEDLYRTLLSSQRNKHTAPVLKEVGEFRALAENLKSDYAVADLAVKFRELSAKPAQTIPQMKALIDGGRKLLELLKSQANSDKKAALEQQIHAFLLDLKEKTGASDAKMGHIYSIIDRRENYFTILELLVEADRDTLDKSCIQQMHEALWNKCPKSRAQYDAAYREKYGCAVTLDSLKNLPDFVCKTIVSDLSRINAVCFKYALDDSREKNLNRMDRVKYSGKMISGNCALEVQLGSRLYEGEWFRKLLKLEHDASSAGDKAELKDAFFTLAEAGAYSGEDLSAALKMISNCGLRFMEFFPLLAQGKFTNTTSGQYRKAYEKILEYNSDRKPATLVRKMNEIFEELGQDRDKNAYKAFLKFSDEYRSDKKKLPKWVIPAAIGGGVVLLALIIVLVVLLTKDKPEETGETTVPTVTQPAETEAPTQPTEPGYAEPLHEILANDADAVELLYGENALADFDSYNTLVQAYLAALDEAAQQQVLDAYEAAGDKPLNLNDLTVTRDEYFFWMLYFNAKNSNPQEKAAFDANLYESDALSVLRVIHHNLILTEDIPAENPATQPEGTEPPASEGETQSTEAPSEPSTEATTEPTTAPTTPPMTMAELKTLVAEAAKGPFEQAQECNANLPLILMLFGKDLDKTFDEHLQLVNDLFSADENTQKQLLQDYNTILGDFAGAAVGLSWDEYAFWNFWLLAKGETEVFNDEESRLLVTRIADILTAMTEEGVSKTNPQANVSLEPGTQPADSSNTETTAPAGDSTAETSAPTEAEDPMIAQVENMGIAVRPVFEAAIEAYKAAVAGVGAAG